jgi:FAD/FMN-containing dehydrogenase
MPLLAAHTSARVALDYNDHAAHVAPTPEFLFEAFPTCPDAVCQVVNSATSSGLLRSKTSPGSKAAMRKASCSCRVRGCALSVRVLAPQRETEFGGVSKQGATECFSTDDADEGERFVEARRAFFPALEGRGALMLEDVGAPVPQLPALLAGIQAISAARQVAIPVVSHAGDGNTHPTIVFDATDETAKERDALAFTEITELAISLCGTITGEHGVGRLKKALLPTQLGPRGHRADQAGQAAPRPGQYPQPGRGHLGPPARWNRSSVAEFVLEVDPDDLIE